MKKEKDLNEKIVQSKISVKMVLLCLLNVACCFFLGWCLYYVFRSDAAEKVYENWWLDYLLPLLFVGGICLLCLIMILYILLCFKYRIVIDKSRRTMTWFSLLYYRGVTLKLEDYTGYYTGTKTTRGLGDGHIVRARQELCYLIDFQDCIH